SRRRHTRSKRDWSSDVCSSDLLVIAIGSQSNDFNTPGVKDNAFFLDSRPQAERFRENFLNTCLQADYKDEPLSVAIVGAGATGEIGRASCREGGWGRMR